MYRFIALALALSLFTAAPVFAVGAAHHKGPNGSQGKQEKIVNITDVQNSAVIASGKNSKANVGVVSNEGGQQRDVVNITKMKNSVVVSQNGGEANVGTVTNK